jgi:SAM-dependent methyltransferase
MDNPASGVDPGRFQEVFYDEQVDYTRGSPHLADLRLRERLVTLTRTAVLGLHDAGLPLDVLEVGAGHGGYTEPMLALGCRVNAVEMSKPSAMALGDRFRSNDRLTAVYDPAGDLHDVGGPFAMIACVSVLHHIPDYLGFVRDALPRLVPGGTFFSLQDPLWYARQRGVQRGFTWLAYLSWRVRQGDIRRGVATTARRIRGTYDESNPSDMVEYHVVRDGVDEQALMALLKPRFDEVSLIPYYSTQAPSATRLGERRRWHNTFGIYATGYRGTTG